MKNRIIYILCFITVCVGAYFTFNYINENRNMEGDNAALIAKQIIEQNNCLSCHSSGAEMPFYGNLPIIGETVKDDMENGLRYIDLQTVYDNLANGKPVSQVDLAKIEQSTLNGSMPLKKYSLIHWGTNLTSKERNNLLNWIYAERAKLSNGLCCEIHTQEPVLPISAAQPVNEAKAALGYKLFHDTRLSGDNTLSCASCHNLETGGVDNKQFSEGINGQFGGVNAPTVFNSVHNVLQFWDGRAKDLQEQAAGPPLNPVEMGSASFDEISAKLESDPAIKAAFTAIYPEGINQQTITDAIAEFEKTLVTPDCKFDRFLKGEKDILSSDELEGYDLFKQNKCATCHVGESMGGQSFEYMGLMANYFEDRGNVKNDDYGHINFTKNEQDRFRFKTPTLRNVALTHPYLHDGSASTLHDATKVMLKYQSGQNLTDQQIDKIVAFLETLTGQMPDLSKYSN